jgi:hypothetical protein
VLTLVEQLEKDRSVELPGAVLIGIRQSGAIGGGDAKIFQFPLAASNPLGNFPERMGSTQLTEKHGYKLTPASKSSGMPLSFFFHHDLLELNSRKQL